MKDAPIPYVNLELLENYFSALDLQANPPVQPFITEASAPLLPSGSASSASASSASASSSSSSASASTSMAAALQPDPSSVSLIALIKNARSLLDLNEIAKHIASGANVNEVKGKYKPLPLAVLKLKKTIHYYTTHPKHPCDGWTIETKFPKRAAYCKMWLFIIQELIKRDNHLEKSHRLLKDNTVNDELKSWGISMTGKAPVKIMIIDGQPTEVMLLESTGIRTFYPFEIQKLIALWNEYSDYQPHIRYAPQYRLAREAEARVAEPQTADEKWLAELQAKGQVNVNRILQNGADARITGFSVQTFPDRRPEGPESPPPSTTKPEEKSGLRKWLGL